MFQRVLRFNYLPAAYIHPERRAGWMDEGLWSRLVACETGRRELSGMVFRRLDLDSPGFFDFAPLRRRFALLQRETLTVLARYSGAAFASQRITRVIDGNRVVKLKEELGEDIYRFAVKRAPFLVSESLCQGPDDDEDGGVEELGWRCLARCHAGDPPELIERLRLKFPLTLDIEFPNNITESDRDQAASLMKKVLLAEVKPELASCFK